MQYSSCSAIDNGFEALLWLFKVGSAAGNEPFLSLMSTLRVFISGVSPKSFSPSEQRKALTVEQKKTNKPSGNSNVSSSTRTSAGNFRRWNFFANLGSNREIKLKVDLMPTNVSNNQTGLLPRVLPKSVESTPSQQLPTPGQQLQPDDFNCLSVDVIHHNANELAQPNAIQLEQAGHNTNQSIDQRTIEDLRCPIQFKNMEAVENASKYEKLKSFYNTGRLDHFYKRYAYDESLGLVNDPKRVDIKKFYAIMKLCNATTKYQNEIYTMYTGLFENGHVFLIAPRESYRIEEDPNNPNKVLFNGNTYSLGVDAIYSGRTFQEVKKLINIVHNNTPLSNHISHILEHEYK
ncbi:hypothetical protein [Endozoicomonas sp. SCSIO W0465]|uniref:hypothetical protein n=1 Tax=Endozoicomonas sp. SCSIO W0465 TaxID=2918516 RepID=UPI0020756B2B|nr:hypothetical protein [Endozoicomonas sp. SCSIO W0465]USE35277.1 hypothetical protein MJO57_24735 [Endozoicomonas sp. SCSIO W0465]